MITYDPQPLTSEDAAVLAKVSTATLTMQLAKRGLHNIFIRRVAALNPDATRFVGPAFTLRHIPMREDITRPELRSDPEYPQRKAIETIPPGQVLTMDCRGERDAGLAGDLLIKRLMVRGAAGLVADGAMRDCAEITKLEFPVFCLGAAAPASMSLHHAVEIQCPIACGGVAVVPGDILVGDADGVVVIPSHLVAGLVEDSLEQEIYEQYAEERIRAGASLLGLYPPDAGAMDEYRRWRNAR